jgi:hypothetical protein
MLSSLKGFQVWTNLVIGSKRVYLFNIFPPVHREEGGESRCERRRKTKSHRSFHFLVEIVNLLVKSLQNLGPNHVHPE